MGILAKVLEIIRNRYLSFAFRIIAGGTLVYSGVTKVLAESPFVDEVAEYDLLPEGLVDVFAATLPWVEIVVGVYLLLGLALRITAVVGALTALSFVIANSVVLHRGLNMDCPCFGDNAAVPTEVALGMDCALFIMAVQIIIHKGEFLSLGAFIAGGDSIELEASELESPDV